MTEKEDWRDLFTLLKLAEMGAHRRTAKISTEYLAEKLGIAQQTASRYLIELERKGWIKRTIKPEGSLIKIDDSRNKRTPETPLEPESMDRSRVPSVSHAGRHRLHRSRRRRLLHVKRGLQETVRRKTRLRTLPGHAQPQTHLGL